MDERDVIYRREPESGRLTALYRTRFDDLTAEPIHEQYLPERKEWAVTDDAYIACVHSRYTAPVSEKDAKRHMQTLEKRLGK